MQTPLAKLWGRWLRGSRRLVPSFLAELAPLDLRFVGRMLFHAALVGAAAGVVGALFFGGLELLQHLLLVDLAGYVPLRAFGELLLDGVRDGEFHPWVLVLLPAAGGLACGLVTRYAPEAQGGGANATIEAFHTKNGILPARLIVVKAVASLCTLGTGGAGGREGPTMLIGATLGSAIGRALGVSARERRVLLLAGVAAGLAAVFRTPLGAALLAVEVLYRDGFESEALVPSVLASVISYSVVITSYGESTLFTHAPRFPFVPAHLPLYGLLALIAAAAAAGFVALLHRVERTASRMPGPEWLRPAVGGLALGLFAVPVILFVGDRVARPGQGIGILGGGYGAVQAAISGSDWLPGGWEAVGILLLLAGAKLVSSSLTIGSGGSAGDFAPSLAIGGVLGGAFGRAAQQILQDPRIDPGAFALVGMGAFYGGIAHVPLSALVFVCEMAGNYDLLVPLMLAEGIAFVALRRCALYRAQVSTLRDSPVHRGEVVLQVLRSLRVRDVMGAPPPEPAAPSSSVGDGAPPPRSADPSVSPEDDLPEATRRLLESGRRTIPVTERDGTIVGTLDESAIGRLYLRAAHRAAESD